MRLSLLIYNHDNYKIKMSSEITREEFDALKKDMENLKKGAKIPKKDRVKRAPSKYNIYVGDKIKEYKIKSPEMKYTEAFKQAVASWNELEKHEKPETKAETKPKTSVK